jgi:hypothetical protein
MFERFTETARQVVVQAQDEARSFRHTKIGTAHLLAALVREDRGELNLAGTALAELHVTYSAVLRELGDPDHRNEVVTGQVPFTDAAKKVLELALREALMLGHNYVGSEHILLGLVRYGDSSGTYGSIVPEVDYDAGNDILRALLLAQDHNDVTDKVRRAVRRKLLLREEPERPSPPSAIDRAVELLKGLVVSGFQCSLTVYGSPPQEVRVNVLYEALNGESVADLASLALTHSFEVEVTRAHGFTFRPA